MNESEDYDRVKSEIIKASSEVFLKYGFAKVSMLSISQASGKGRSTLYYYFKNKNEVLEAFAAVKFEKLLDQSQKHLSADAGFIHNMETYYKTKLQHFRKLLDQYSLLIEDMKAQPSLFITKSKLFFKEESDVIRKIILWANQRGEIAPLEEENIDFLASTLVTTFRSFEQDILLFGGLENFESKITWMTQILYKGLK